MGKIEWVGIINDFFNDETETITSTAIPDNAQFLVMSLTPLFVLGIIPLIIVFIKYPKEKMSFEKGLKYWILTVFIAVMTMACCPDIIQSFNFIKHIPNNAIVEDGYWYVPN